MATVQNWMLQLGFSVKKTDGRAGAAEALQRQGIRTPGDSGVTNAPAVEAAEPANASHPIHIPLQEVNIPLIMVSAFQKPSIATLATVRPAALTLLHITLQFPVTLLSPGHGWGESKSRFSWPEGMPSASDL